jgi:DNA-binding Xre family transcriptional regulator
MTLDRSKLMARQLGYKRSPSPEGKDRIEQALKKKVLTGRADNNIIKALEKENVFITAKTWQRFWDGKQNIDRTTFKEICQFLGINWQDIVLPSQILPRSNLLPSDLVPSDPIPSNPNFYGRTTELKILQEWVTSQFCRLVILYGLDGIGKSSLVRQLKTQVSKSFQRVEWKTFSYGDSVESTLIDLLHQLDSQNSLSDLSLQQLKNRFFEQLQQHRYLIILEQEQDGRTDKYEDYKNLLRKSIGCSNGKPHLSCILMITSYENPNEVRTMANFGEAQSLHLQGVDTKTGLEIVKNKEPKLITDEEAATDLLKWFNGHPLALKLVSSQIRDRYNGDVRKFLSNPSVPQHINDILKQLIQNLDNPAQVILDILKDSEPMTQADLQKVCTDRVPDVRNFTMAKDTLLRRSLLVRYDDGDDFFYGLEEVTKQFVRRYLPNNT